MHFLYNIWFRQWLGTTRQQAIAWVNVDQDLQCPLRESIPRLFNWGSTAMTARCAPACSQVLPVKPQGVWARGIEAWPPKLELQRWGSSGPSSLMHITSPDCSDWTDFWLRLKLRLHGTRQAARQPRRKYRNIGIQQERLHGDTLQAADARLLRARAAI